MVVEEIKIPYPIAEQAIKLYKAASKEALRGVQKLYEMTQDPDLKSCEVASVSYILNDWRIVEGPCWLGTALYVPINLRDIHPPKETQYLIQIHNHPGGDATPSESESADGDVASFQSTQEFINEKFGNLKCIFGIRPGTAEKPEGKTRWYKCFDGSLSWTTLDDFWPLFNPRGITTLDDFCPAYN